MNKNKEDCGFCRAYLRTMNPEQAASEVGRQDGFALLGKRQTQSRLEQMRTDAAAQIRREDVLRRLVQLAFGRANDALLLALHPRDAKPELLDLSAVAEFKVTEKGVEVKLADRIRALEALWGMLEPNNGGGADDLYQALEDAARQMEDNA